MNELKQQQMGLQGLSFPSTSPAFGAPAPMLAPQPLLPPADPWAPATGAALPVGANAVGMPVASMGVDARSSSPWSPPHQRHTPNPFLS